MVSLIKVEMKIKVSDLLSLCFVFVFVKLYVSLTMSRVFNCNVYIKEGISSLVYFTITRTKM